MTLQIELASPLLPEVSALIYESDAFAQALYPPESNHLMDIDALAQPNVIFCVARLDGMLMGCGAAVLMPDGYAEIKRMFVRESARGRRIGYHILTFLETQVKAHGLSVARLETGVLNHDAIRLYEKMGYVRIPPFGDYRDDPLSLFYEKYL
ncbi:MAG: GNAT family N-acetyltransferase [Caldilinea sp.]|nr:GNAT family N-acetyltransferase [Caldilinea sp.]MDW8440331.1 GNAT family N-acetyltransferase [Caldilineaceae bacterium]